MYRFFMNRKTIVAVVALSGMVCCEIANHYMDSLVPNLHTHTEMRTEPVASTISYMAASGVLMRSVMRETENGVVGKTFLYEIDLPFARTAQIIYHVNRGPHGHLCRSWQFRKITRGTSTGSWTGYFASPYEAAQAALFEDLRA